MHASPRRRAREFVLQGLYQRQLSGNAPDDIRRQLVESPGFHHCDAAYFDAMWTSVVAEFERLTAALPLTDRKVALLSPIERALVAMGAWELHYRPDIPYRVAINEAVELAKAYGGIDGHRFVNGVLDKIAARERAPEIDAEKRAAGAA